MTSISGFTFVKNAVAYDFPVVESIQSLLPLVDEMIVLLGDSEDETDNLIATIDSPKLKLYRSKWDLDTYHVGGSIYAQQTDLAKSYCTGNWCVYIQADEVLHEDAIPVIRSAIQDYDTDASVEGFTLRYYHFYGSYYRHIDNQHFAYPHEIRIIRNHPDIHSWRDAQSFRHIPDFDGVDYYKREGTRKLRIISLDAYIYHYGYCRNPLKMGKKKKEQESSHYGEHSDKYDTDRYEYGNLSYLPLFQRSHPAVMHDRIVTQLATWEQYNRYTGPPPQHLPKVFRTKYRIISFIEQKLLGGIGLGVFKNYTKMGRYPRR